MKRMPGTLLLVLCVSVAGAVGRLPLKAADDGPRAEIRVSVATPTSSSLVTAGDPQEPAGPKLRLEDLEQMATQHNPTLAQAAARIRATRGRKLQAGLYPNPMMGYTGEEISSGPIIRGGEHGFFFEQEFVTGGKLKRSRSAFAQEEMQAEAAAEMQKYRVLNTVRFLYYRALGAERLLALRSKLAGLTREAVEISKQLYNVGQADQPDVLQAEVEAQRAELAQIAARNDRQRIGQQLAAVVGVPSLNTASLAGTLEESIPEMNPESALQGLLQQSPEIKMAQAGVGRAEQILQSARAERIPNLVVRGGLRNNRERLETGGKPIGLEGFVEAGARIPIFNRNQGAVQAARADLERAQLEVQRVELSLQARLAVSYKNYIDSVTLAERYHKELLPRAQQAYDLYLAKYKQRAAAYPQVLIAQRTLFQLQVDYVTSLENAWHAVVELRGFLLGDGLEQPLSPRRTSGSQSTAEE